MCCYYISYRQLFSHNINKCVLKLIFMIMKDSVLGRYMYKYFVCLWFIIALEKLSLIWRRHHCRWRTANFDLCSPLMTIEQWGFFSVPDLLWYWASVYNGYFRGPVTLTPFAESLAEELSLTVFTTKVCRGCDSNTQRSACGANALTQCATAAACCLLFLLFLFVCIWL